MISLTRVRAALAFGTLLIAAGLMTWPLQAAEIKEGGQNVRTHKVPRHGTVKCRICAGKRCTIVAVRGRCTKRAALAALELRLKRGSHRRMPINPPILDDRTYDDLPSKSRSRVPRHTPEWTDHNESDPGMGILQAGRRNPASVRVQPVAPKRSLLPEVEDEVLTGFEQGRAE